MERLIKDYITYLSSDERASTKFNKGNMMFDFVRFLQDGVIIFDDLDEFSDELRENVRLLWERFK